MIIPLETGGGSAVNTTDRLAGVTIRSSTTPDTVSYEGKCINNIIINALNQDLP